VPTHTGEELVRRSGHEVDPTKTEFRLLLELVTAAGRVVTREELLQRVCGPRLLR
jgi:two-component system response regulator MtrA